MVESICGAACLCRKMVCCPIGAPILLSACLLSAVTVMCSVNMGNSTMAPIANGNDSHYITKQSLRNLENWRQHGRAWHVLYTVLYRPELNLLQGFVFAYVDNPTENVSSIPCWILNTFLVFIIAFLQVHTYIQCPYVRTYCTCSLCTWSPHCTMLSDRPPV